MGADKPKDLDQGNKSPARPVFGRMERKTSSKRFACFGTLSFAALRQLAHAGGRQSVTLAEAAVEIGQVAKTAVERDRTDGAYEVVPVDQDTIGARQALLADEIGEAGVFAFEQLAYIARCDALIERSAEGDITGTGLKSSATGTPMCMTPFCNPSAPVPGASQYMAQDINWLASLRGRLGYSWGSSLFYVTGGAAWANISYRADSADATWVCNGGGGGGAGCSYPASFDSTKTGWAVGAGYEAMITANWSLRAEYLYYSFGGTTASAAGTPAAACQVADCSATYIFSATDIHTARVGVNYRF
ncbi:outer membrane protein [Bradyrhizobium sediminis]|uniref:outer membrane protein n=1 Tax=Bradyrhizobium sediminis TaxID=2840469 RepID=UPI003FA36519